MPAIKIRRVDNGAMRRLNETIVFNLIRKHTYISRADLARSTGLKESTISSIVKSLLHKKFIFEEEFGNSTGGRRPRMLGLNNHDTCVIGISIGLHQTVIGVASLLNKITYAETFPTDRAPENLLQNLSTAVKKVLESEACQSAQILGIGVSTPGVVDPHIGVMLYSSNLHWMNVSVGSMLSTNFNFKLGENLIIDEDVRATALAEMWSNEILDSRHIVHLRVAEGLGCAIFIDDHLYRGRTMGAGQWGHVSINPAGPVCPCNNNGCLELYTSDSATVSYYLEESSQSSNLMATPDGHICIDYVVNLALEGDGSATKALMRTAGYLGTGIAMLVNILNPGTVIITGKITRAWALIYSRLLEEIKTKALEINWRSLHVMPGKIYDDPSLTGACSLILTHLFDMAAIA